MLIFNIIISFIIILIIYFALKETLKKLVCVFMNYEYDSYYFLFPTSVILGIWSLVFILWYFTLSTIQNVDIIGVFSKYITNDGNIENSFILTTFLFIILGLIAQIFAVLLVNIDYKKIFGNTRFFFKKIFRVRNVKRNKLVIKNEPDKIGFITALFISVLLFIIFIFSLTILILIGVLIGKNFA